MKVGVITIVRVNNYGAELQAFATQKALQMSGYDAEIIDYYYFTNTRHIATKQSKPVFNMPLKLRIVVWLYPWYNRFKRLKGDKQNYKSREQRFEAFHKQYTRFSHEYKRIEDLYSAEMTYDAYIVGSDQVWNPNNYTSLDPYFLKFAPRGKKKISYASSFGVSSIPEKTVAYYKDALGGLDAISVREENAVKLVEEISGRSAQWVLDPTLLLRRDDWLKYANKPAGIPERYVLIYEVTPCTYLKDLALYLADRAMCRVVRINREAVREEKDEEVINVMDGGPAEFIWLFGNATMVVTNSFHGTAFSLNMNKDFYVVTPVRKSNNSRQKSILKLFGIEDRLVVENSSLDIEIKKVDYTHVNAVLDVQREKSLSYLKNAIDGK